MDVRTGHGPRVAGTARVKDFDQRWLAEQVWDVLSVAHACPFAQSVSQV